MKRIATELTEIKMILKEYCKQLYANILDNLDEMNKFSKRQTIEMDLSRNRQYE